MHFFKAQIIYHNNGRPPAFGPLRLMLCCCFMFQNVNIIFVFIFFLPVSIISKPWSLCLFHSTMDCFAFNPYLLPRQFIFLKTLFIQKWPKTVLNLIFCSWNASTKQKMQFVSTAVFSYRLLQLCAADACKGRSTNIKYCYIQFLKL